MLGGTLLLCGVELLLCGLELLLCGLELLLCGFELLLCGLELLLCGFELLLCGLELLLCGLELLCSGAEPLCSGAELLCSGLLSLLVELEAIEGIVLEEAVEAGELALLELDDELPVSGVSLFCAQAVMLKITAMQVNTANIRFFIVRSPFKICPGR